MTFPCRPFNPMLPSMKHVPRRTAIFLPDFRGFVGSALAGALDATSPDPAGCRVLVHVLPRLDLRSHEPTQHLALVAGAQAALAIARREATITAFVLVSDAAVHCDGGPVVGADESRACRPIGAHARATHAAERRVLGADGPGLRTIVVRPGTVWGVGDDHFLPEIEHAARGGHFVWISGGRFPHSTCHVRNLAEAVRLAVDGGVRGLLLVADGPPTPTFRAFVTALLDARGVRPPTRSLPFRLARAAATGLEAGWTVAGRRRAPPLTRSIVARWGRPFEVDDGRIRRLLGYKPVITLEQGLHELHRARAD